MQPDIYIYILIQQDFSFSENEFSGNKRLNQYLYSVNARFCNSPSEYKLNRGPKGLPNNLRNQSYVTHWTQGICEKGKIEEDME